MAVAPMAVVPVAAEPPPRRAATTTCERCQGICDAEMRFCKYCGAPLSRGAVVAVPAAEEALRYGRLQRELGEVQALEVPVPPERAPEEQLAAVTGAYEPLGIASTTSWGRLVIVAGDGQEGPSFPLMGDQLDVGRSEGSVILGEDQYMSPRHARFVHTKDGWIIRDLGSTNGVFLRLTKTHELDDGDLLLLGVEVLRFELTMDAEMGLGPAVQHGTLLFGSPATPRPARLVQRTVEGVARDVYHLHRPETVIGRESGDIVFTDDPYMSRRHALVRRVASSGAYSLSDLNSSNGTFVAIRGDHVLQDGDSVRVGQHLFRVELAPNQTAGK